MKRTKYQEVIKKFTKKQQRLKKLKIGQKVYITDMWYDFFECEITKINLSEGSIEVIDHSIQGKPKKTLDVNGFYTEQEAKELFRTPAFKYKPF